MSEQETQVVTTREQIMQAVREGVQQGYELGHKDGSREENEACATLAQRILLMGGASGIPSAIRNRIAKEDNNEDSTNTATGNQLIAG